MKNIQSSRAGDTFKKSRIVILSDNISALESLTNTIEGWGLNIALFTRVSAAIEYVDDNGCDIVLLHVPISGICALDLIPQFGRDLKVIVTAQSHDKELGVRALQNGAFDLLVKPIDQKIMRHSILRALTVLENERQRQRLMDHLEQSRTELSRRQRLLENLNAQLFDTNRALSALARNVEREREETEGRIALILRNLMMPIVEKLRNDPCIQEYESQLNVLTCRLEELTSGFSIEPSVVMTLSAGEMRVASLIKNGVGAAEIARQLHISENTVRSQRRSIRKKLKIKGPHSLKNILGAWSPPRRAAVARDMTARGGCGAGQA